MDCIDGHRNVKIEKEKNGGKYFDSWSLGANNQTGILN